MEETVIKNKLLNRAYEVKNHRKINKEKKTHSSALHGPFFL